MIPLDKEHIQRVRNIVANRGVELTPDEMRELTTKTLKRIRDAEEWELTGDDHDLFRDVLEAFNSKFRKGE